MDAVGHVLVFLSAFVGALVGVYMAKPGRQ